MELIKFSREHCVPCKILSQYLNEKGVKYTEVHIDNLSDYGLSVMGVPVLLLVDENKNPIEFTVGFNPSNTHDIDNLISKS